jgi:hypothetical protein
MLIEVAETHPAAPGKKVATVIAVGGAKFDIWPEQLGGIQVGGRYEVEVSQREFNGRVYQKITKATPVNGSAATTLASTAKPVPARCDKGNSYRRTDPLDSERMFVCAALTAFIKAGKVEPELGKVSNAITVLRTAYQNTFGIDERISTPSEAGHRHVAREVRGPCPTDSI